MTIEPLIFPASAAADKAPKLVRLTFFFRASTVADNLRPTPI